MKSKAITCVPTHKWIEERKTCKKNLNHVVIDENNLTAKGREKEGIQSKEISNIKGGVVKSARKREGVLSNKLEKLEADV